MPSLVLQLERLVQCRRAVVYQNAVDGGDQELVARPIVGVSVAQPVEVTSLLVHDGWGAGLAGRNNGSDAEGVATADGRVVAVTSA